MNTKVLNAGCSGAEAELQAWLVAYRALVAAELRLRACEHDRTTAPPALVAEVTQLREMTRQLFPGHLA